MNHRLHTRHALAGALGAVAVAAAAAVMIIGTPAWAAPAPALLNGDDMYAQAVELFRAGRLSAAYGRFARLADLGHPASARQALWLCENGPAMLDRNWDCSTDQVADWAAAAGMPAPTMRPQVQRRPGPVPAMPWVHPARASHGG